MRWIYALSLLLSLTSFASANEIKRFVFGSCNNQNKYQSLWNEMLKKNPDLFIWGGDNVYADKEYPPNLERAFKEQNSNKEYQKFKSRVPMIGTWDDHDYGSDNLDGTYVRKKESQKLFLDFLDEPQNSQRRMQEGVYTSYNFGRIKFILLDNRYFMNLDSNASMLGEDQWRWLEEELENSDAKVIFIVSGLSILSPYHPLIDSTWANYPSERKRLLDLVERQNKGVIFLTGDLHFSSIFRRRGNLEFLSSGLTHRVIPPFWWYFGRRYETSFFGINYGQVDVAWDGGTPVVTMSIHNRSGEEFHKRTFRLEANEWIEQFVLFPL